MAPMWTFALVRLAGILFVGLLVGLLVGPAWLWILIAACAYLVWQMSNLYRLDRWLRRRSPSGPVQRRCGHRGRLERPASARQRYSYCLSSAYQESSVTSRSRECCPYPEYKSSCQQ